MTVGWGTPVYAIVPQRLMEVRHAVVPSSKLGGRNVRHSDVCHRPILYESEMCKG